MDELKSRLRESALQARRRLAPDERHRASSAIVERLLGLPSLRMARTVLLYAPMSEEADVSTAVAPLRERGMRTLLPRVRGDELELAAAGDLHALDAGYRGIREPTGPSIDPEVIDLVVVPGVAFDPHGGRLGHGGGHYDRLLARLAPECLRVGTCFACQVVPRVPREEHDEPVDIVLTEHARYLTEARELRDDA